MPPDCRSESFAACLLFAFNEHDEVDVELSPLSQRRSSASHREDRALVVGNPSGIEISA